MCHFVLISAHQIPGKSHLLFIAINKSIDLVYTICFMWFYVHYRLVLNTYVIIIDFITINCYFYNIASLPLLMVSFKCCIGNPIGQSNYIRLKQIRLGCLTWHGKVVHLYLLDFSLDRLMAWLMAVGVLHFLIILSTTGLLFCISAFQGIRNAYENDLE